MAGVPQPWKWPEAIFDLRGLFKAMANGFDLHVRYSDKGVATYELRRDGQKSPPNVVPQSVAHHAASGGLLGHPIKLADGSFLIKRTTKSTGVS